MVNVDSALHCKVFAPVAYSVSPPAEWVQRANRSDNTDMIFRSIYLQKGYDQAVKRVKKAKTKETDGQTYKSYA